MISRSDCEARDAADSLAPLRALFALERADQQGVIYLDGNSLGPLPKAAAERVLHVIEEEWGLGLVRSWNSAGWITLALGAVLLALSRRCRMRASAWLATPVGFFTAVTILAAVLSFGPEIRARGRLIAGTGPYALLYNHVPGFDGLRVPARFGMIVALGLAVLAGCACARMDLAARWRFAIWMAAALIVAEACSLPVTINDAASGYEQAGLAPVPGSLETETSRLVYGAVARLPDQAAVIELPLGEPAFDIRYMYYSTRHWKRLVNGYSGSEPVEYGLLDQNLRDIFTRPDYAWQALRASGATHAIVHESFYADDRGPRDSAWLQANGAVEIASFETDRIFELARSAGR